MEHNWLWSDLEIRQLYGEAQSHTPREGGKDKSERENEREKDKGERERETITKDAVSTPNLSVAQWLPRHIYLND